MNKCNYFKSIHVHNITSGEKKSRRDEREKIYRQMQIECRFFQLNLLDAKQNLSHQKTRRERTESEWKKSSLRYGQMEVLVQLNDITGLSVPLDNRVSK